MKATLPSISCVDKLKVLADSNRLSILELLMTKPCHVGEINAVLGLEQSLLSHHLRVLRDAKLVVSERDGKAVLYRLAPEVTVTASDKALNLGCCLLSFH